jgi:WD40 repeat protein
LGTGDELCHKATWLPGIAFDPQGTRIASVQHEQGRNRIDVCDAETGQQLLRLSGHDAAIAGLASSFDGLLYSWDFRGNIRSWDLDKQREQWSFSLLEWAASGK